MRVLCFARPALLFLIVVVAPPYGPAGERPSNSLGSTRAAHEAVEVVAADDRAADAAVYYVSPAGDDANTGTTESDAFLSIQRAADIVEPGDTVLILPGTYTSTNPDRDIVKIRRSGEAGRWITFKNYPGSRPVLFNQRSWQAINIYGASFIIIEGLEVVGNGAGITRAQAESAHRHVAATNGNCIMAFRDGSTVPHHLIIRDNVVHHCPGGGIGTNYADYVRIYDNIVYNTSWWSRWGTSGISIYESRNINDHRQERYRNIIAGNVVYGNEQRLPTAGLGAVTDGNGIIIDDLNNTQSDGPPYIGKTLVTNNISYNNGGRGIHVYKSNGVDVVNNTLCHNNIILQDAGDLSVVSSSEVSAINNIVVARRGRVAMYVHGGNEDVVFTSNLFFEGLAMEAGAGALLEHPRFVDAPRGNFRLHPKLPAIDTGSSMLAPSKDAVGMRRPQGAGCDRGAYEWGSIGAQR